MATLSTSPDKLTEVVGGGFLVADDGMELYFKVWKPETKPSAVVLFFHGLGEHVQRYDHFFTRMSENGVLVKAFDMRGHGRTYWRNVYSQKLTVLKGYTESFDRIYKDMELLYKMPVDGVDNIIDIPTFVFGHSFGGLLSVCFTKFRSTSIKNYRGTISQAPAFAPTAGPPALLKWIARHLGHWAPKHLEKNSLDIQGLSNDPQVIEVYKKDPFVHDKISLQLGRDILIQADLMIASRKEFTYPLIVYHSPQDKLTDFNATKMFLESVGSTDVTFKSMDGCAHELHNEFGDVKWKLSDEYLAWINDHLELKANL